MSIVCWLVYTKSAAIFVLGCELVWTGGYAAVPSSETNWVWTMEQGTTKPIGYTDWRAGDPNNYNGEQEDAIVVSRDHQYTWIDVTLDATENGWFTSNTICFVCEINF